MFQTVTSTVFTVNKQSWKWSTHHIIASRKQSSIARTAERALRQSKIKLSLITLPHTCNHFDSISIIGFLKHFKMVSDRNRTQNDGIIWICFFIMNKAASTVQNARLSTEGTGKIYSRSARGKKRYFTTYTYVIPFCWRCEWPMKSLQVLNQTLRASGSCKKWCHLNMGKSWWWNIPVWKCVRIVCLHRDLHWESWRLDPPCYVRGHGYDCERYDVWLRQGVYICRSCALVRRELGWLGWGWLGWGWLGWIGLGWIWLADGLMSLEKFAFVRVQLCV